MPVVIVPNTAGVVAAAQARRRREEREREQEKESSEETIDTTEEYEEEMVEMTDTPAPEPNLESSTEGGLIGIAILLFVIVAGTVFICKSIDDLFTSSESKDRNVRDAGGEPTNKREILPEDILFKGVCPMCFKNKRMNGKRMNDATYTFHFGDREVNVCEEHLHEFIDGVCKQYSKMYPEKFKNIMKDIQKGD